MRRRAATASATNGAGSGRSGTSRPRSAHNRSTNRGEVAVTRVSPRDALGEVVDEPQLSVLGAREAPHQGDALGLQRPGVQVVAAVDAAGGELGDEPGLRRRQRLDRPRHESRLERPPEHVVVADPSRNPRGPAARQDHRPTGVDEVLGDLAPGLPASHDEHDAIGHHRRVPIGTGVEHRHVCGQAVGPGRGERSLVGAGAHHHAARRHRTVRGGEVEPFAAGLQGVHLDAFEDGSVHLRSIAFEVGNHLGSRREGIRVGTAVGQPRQPHAPVRGVQPEVVPQARPRRADPVALQDEVVDPGQPQLATGGQPRLPPADHDDVGTGRHRRSDLSRGRRPGSRRSERSRSGARARVRAWLAAAARARPRCACRRRSRSPTPRATAWAG